MTYDTREKSRRNGEPVEYVRFTLGSQIFRYTTSPDDEMLFDEKYLAEKGIKRSSPTLTPELAQNTLTITIPRSTEIPSLFSKASPRQQIFVIIYRKHRGDSDNQAISYWQGGVEGIGFKGEEAEISCGSLESLLKRGGLRYRFSPRCRFYFCDGRCPVPAASVTIEAVADYVDGSIVKAPEYAAYPDGTFKFGEFSTPELESRFIVEHIGDTLTLIAPFYESPQSKLCKVLMGCDYTPETCQNKFGQWTDNGRDFGGFDSIPVQNIFESGIG